jgi:adenylate cyclase
MQNYVWRRHLATAAGRLMTESPAGSHTRTLVVGFADMVEFTRTTRELPPLELLELVDGFQAVAADLVATHHGRVVKTVGDEVLFITEHPAEAAEIALGFIEQVRAIESLPQLRIGMALGPVLTRFGDVYGEVVNIASRLTTHAKPGRILIDAALAEALEHDSTYRVRPRRALNVRGYRRLQSWGLTATDRPRT